jgi:hypothetical protein
VSKTLQPKSLLTMARLHAILAFAGIATYFLPVYAITNSTPIAISSTPVNASAPIPEAFVSFSIELAFFPDFAG